MKTPTEKHTRPLQGTWQVYRREIEARMATKGYLVSLLVLGLLMFGLTVGLDFAGKPKTSSVAACGAPAADFGPAPSGARLVPCPDLDAARRLTADRKAEAAAAVTADHVTVVLRGDTPDQARAVALALGRAWATNHAYALQHIDTAALDQAVVQAGPRLDTVGAGVGAAEISGLISMIVVLFMQIVGQGSAIAQGVVEEKSTRIVEVLLATVSPLQLMVGKVAGIATAAVVQVAAMLGAMLGARGLFPDAGGSLPGTAALLSAGFWFLLSFALFAGLFAAAGSLVSRPEDLQTVLMPLVLLTLAPVAVAVAAVQSLSSSWVQIVQYVPPFSGLLMPLQAGAGNVSLPQQAAAAAVTIAATAVTMRLAARVYRNSILRVGAAVRWRQALAA
ncbi:hypothetical protein ATKI12_1362 [Kitasatospora sp. Ki12]|uniref:ABC transporter permease n=1 Tax=Kitasatospora xanthocidica TaxID=83382 RepID=UPI001674E92C|nr:ABC transporter permease [Kitasatospora xanthocidica]GHF64521.1 ABC transporter permease [Kitasatospora xanthocidica]